MIHNERKSSYEHAGHSFLIPSRPILARILQSDEREITPDVARYLVSMRLPHEDEERVNELCVKHRAGSSHRRRGAGARQLSSYRNAAQRFCNRKRASFFSGLASPEAVNRDLAPESPVPSPGNRCE